MSENIQILIEDYKRRLNSIQMLMADETLKDETDRYIRLGIKASCYRTFIAELESALRE